MGIFFRPPLVGDSLVVSGAFSFIPKNSGASDMDSASAVILAVTAVPRIVTILSADIQKKRFFIIQDETGTAGDLGMQIVVNTEGGALINGFASVAITSDFGNLSLYSNSIDLFILNKT
jgi:hypothetical protein